MMGPCLIPILVHLVRKVTRLFRSIKASRIPYVAVGFLAVVLFNSFMFWLVEGHVQGLSLMDAVYWAFITTATIGYGDVVPHSWAGRIVAVETAVTGIIVFTAFVSVLAEYYASLSYRRLMGLHSVGFKEHYVVIGKGGSLEAVVSELDVNMKSGNIPRRRIVVIVPSSEEKEELSIPEGVEVLVGDPLIHEVLERANVEEAGTLIIAADDDSTTALTILAVKRAAKGKEVKIIAEAKRKESIPLIREAGADHVVSTSCFSGRLLASAAFEAPVAMLLDDISTAVKGKDLAVISAKRFKGMKYVDVFHELMDKHNIMPIAVVKGRLMIYPPRLDEELVEDDGLVVLGEVEKLRRLRKEAASST